MSTKIKDNDITVYQGHYDDIDEYIANLKSWHLDIGQIAHGHPDINQLSICLSDNDYEYLFFQHKGKSIHKAYQPKNGISFLVPLSDQNITFLEHQVDQPAISCSPFEQEINLITPDHFQGATIFISFEIFHYLLEHSYDSPICCPPRYGSSIYCPTTKQLSDLQTALNAIKKCFSASDSTSQDNTQWLKEISETTIFPLLSNIMSNELNKSVKPRPYPLLKAIELTTNNLDSPPSISELALEVGVTPRYLQFLFKSHLVMTPKQFITITRLNTARRRLRHTDYGRGKVADIANQLGYWHMGSFSQDFKKLFNSNPADLLRLTPEQFKKGNCTK